ncbi:hypothetical protein K0M31_003623 [Melipona bicolor]|uniref:Uncharacterized protein n=1 Tax=Melipona bicolor TaxID=60889 RepID=A0AA40KPR2_9HYME|nr:hypothetical protein K0M31_003623 [Melipona bicolor]
MRSPDSGGGWPANTLARKWVLTVSVYVCGVLKLELGEEIDAHSWYKLVSSGEERRRLAPAVRRASLVSGTAERAGSWVKLKSDDASAVVSPRTGL